MFFRFRHVPTVTLNEKGLHLWLFLGMWLAHYAVNSKREPPEPRG